MAMHPRVSLTDKFEVVIHLEVLLLKKPKTVMCPKISLTNESEVASASFETEMSEWIGALMAMHFEVSLVNESEMVMANESEMTMGVGMLLMLGFGYANS